MGKRFGTKISSAAEAAPGELDRVCFAKTPSSAELAFAASVSCAETAGNALEKAA